MKMQRKVKMLGMVMISMLMAAAAMADSGLVGVRMLWTDGNVDENARRLIALVDKQTSGEFQENEGLAKGCIATVTSAQILNATINGENKLVYKLKLIDERTGVEFYTLIEDIQNTGNWKMIGKRNLKREETLAEGFQPQIHGYVFSEGQLGQIASQAPNVPTVQVGVYDEVAGFGLMVPFSRDLNGSRVYLQDGVIRSGASADSASQSATGNKATLGVEAVTPGKWVKLNAYVAYQTNGVIGNVNSPMLSGNLDARVLLW